MVTVYYMEIKIVLKPLWDLLIVHSFEFCSKLGIWAESFEMYYVFHQCLI
jgi:hypothetical protein